MNRVAALLLGFFTVLPILYVFYFIMMMTGAFELGNVRFESIFILHLGIMLLMVGLMVVYIVHLLKTDRIENDMKAVWAIVIFMGGMIGMLAYWYLFLWRKERS